METKPGGASLKINDFSFTYPQQKTPALQNINLWINSGELIVLCGPSGCGKTTLLRQCKPILASHGIKTGSIFLNGVPLDSLSARDAAAKIGFVQQSPENQIVTDKVWHELAFGLESLGLASSAIRLRVAEMASFFGIQEWFYRSVTELSGGQKQLLALASVMAMQPSILLLDEPTSQLDPIAAAEFLAAVSKINRELGVTVLLSEHRLEEAFPLCSRAVVMDNGRILCDGKPSDVGKALRSASHGMFAAMPAPMRIWAGVENNLPCPVTVQEGREWISKMQVKYPIPQEAVPPVHNKPSVELEEVWFKYDKELPDIIKGLNFTAFPGEITAILGGNGTGKTTSLSLISGLNKPYRGKVKLNGADIGKISSARLFNNLLGVLPQNPQALFTAKTVEEDLMEILSETNITKAERKEQAYHMARLCGLTHLLQSHPYDLSGGEQQRTALAKVLLLKPRILLLDEPTKGLDAEFKQVFAGILHKLTAAGVTVIMVSHDIEFCAEHADRCALFFDGSIVTEGTPRKFFCGNSFYTSAANRMARHVLPEAVTSSDVITALGGIAPDKTDEQDNDNPDGTDIYSLNDQPIISPEKKKLSLPRKIIAGISASAFICTLIILILNFKGFQSFISGGSEAINTANNPAAVWRYVGIMFCFALEAVLFVGALTYKRESKDRIIQTQKQNRRLPKRTIAAAAIILLAIPATIYIGICFLGDRKYTFISLLIILETMLPFILVFEGRKPQARELIILAVLTAIAVAGRAAFFMLPQFKPVVAITIIAGVAFGGEAGFLVGALAGFVSNMLLGQGPWTPWQMFAFGIIGFLAGVLFKKGVLLRSRGALCVFGGLATFIIYGGLMNPASVLMYQSHPTMKMFLAAYLQGIPFDLVHALATIFFLMIISQPMLEKLERIKIKYGLIERQER